MKTAKLMTFGMINFLLSIIDIITIVIFLFQCQLLALQGGFSMEPPVTCLVL